MADLMDFTEEEMEENRYVRDDEDEDDDGDDPNVVQTAPRLAQSPVIVNSILKQSTKDNLIQLYTPHQKPEKGKLKVHFGHDSLLQTPTVKQLKTRNTENNGVKFEENGKENSPKTPVMCIEGKNKQMGKKILDTVLDQVPENECTEKGPTSPLPADERLEESAMEISIYESQSEQPLQTVDSTEDILRQAELLLLSLKGDSAEPASKVDESEHYKAENQNDDSLKDGTETAMLKTDTPIKQEISETCINEKELETKIKEEPGIKVKEEPFVQNEGQADLLNAEEKSGCTDSTTGKIFINQENVEVSQKVHEFSKNEEEPMDYEEEMDVDDGDSEIVFNIGKNKESNVEETVDQNVEKESQNEEKRIENEKTDQPQSETNSEEIVKDQVEEIASTNEKSSVEKNKMDSGASPKSKESEEVVEMKGKETIDITEKDKVSLQNHNDEKKTTEEIEGSQKPESKRSGDESSDEEFLSADEDIDDNKVKTPTKPESQETGKSNENPVSDSPERTPPKVGYNLDFDDLEAMDPFSTKKSLMNSPAINQPLQKDSEKETGTKVKKVPKGKLPGNKNNSTKPTEKGKVESSSASTTPAKMQELNKTVSKNDLNKENCSKAENVNVDVVDDKTKNVQDNVKDKSTPSKSVENEIAVTTKSNEESEQNKAVDLNNKQINRVETMEESGIKGTPQKANTEEVTAVAEDCITSPPLPTSNGVYNLDALELDDVDPFKPKKQMMNSPVRNPDNAAVVEDPFKPKSQIQNSPVTKTEGQKKPSPNKLKPDVENKEPVPSEKVENKKAAPSSEVESKTDVLLNKADENESKSKKDVPSNENESKKDLPLNEVESKKDVSSNNETGEIAKDKKNPNEEVEKNQNPKTSKPVKKKTLPKKPVEEMSSHLEGESDPFKPKSQIQNSPAINKNVQNEINEFENLDEVDPFKPKSQIMNSPDSKSEQKAKDEVVDSFDEIDPFKSKTKVANSPVKKNAENPTDGKEDTDSPSFDDLDPFKPKKQMQNSPVKTTTETKDDKSNEVEPVDSAKEIQNSPVKKETETEMKTLDMLGSETFDDIDPFKAKKQMQNSPVSKNFSSNNDDKTLTDGEHTELSESKQNESADTKEKKKDEKLKKDKTKKETGKNKYAEQKVNKDMPDPFADLNPFQTKSKVASSPTKAENNVADSTDDVNPFKSNSKIANSPEIQSRGDDPFVTESRMANTPTKAEEGDDPFKQKFELPTTPTNDGVNEEANDIFEVQGITRRGQASTQDQFGNIDESQFVSASEVFNDPAAWEMLEKLGGGGTSSADSALSRMSLYVKFDPLVTASNPRRISIRMSQLEKVKEYGLDDTLLLLGTPPKKKRQSMTASQFKITPSGPRSMQAMQAKGPPPSAKNTEPVAPTPGAVDLILAYSPSEKEQAVIPKAGMKTGPVLSLLDAAANNEDNLVQELKYTDEDLLAVRREMDLVTQGLLLKKDQEWCQEKKQWEREKAELIKKCQQIKTDKEKIEVAFLNLEQLVNEIAAAREAADKKVLDVMAEKNQLLQDIQGVENSFADLHKRYEKARNMVLSQQKNEETLKKYAADKVNDLKKMEEKVHSVEKSLNEKLAAKSQEIEKLKKEHDSVQSKLDAQTKIMQMKIDNLETSLKTKTEENKQLTEICDNLLAKVQ